MFGTLLNTCAPAVRQRRKMEWLVVRRFLVEARKAGWTAYCLNDGGENIALSKDATVKQIMEKMFSVDEEHVFFQRPLGGVTPANGKPLISRAWVHFVYGNDGWDAVSDYTGNLNMVAEHVYQLSDRIERKFCDDLMARARK